MQLKLEPDKKDLQGFLAQCTKVGEKILAMQDPLIVGHYDADGLSATGIVAFARKTKEKNYATKTIKRIDDKTLGELAATGKKEFVFVDIGSAAIDRLAGLGDVAVIDHHPPREFEWQANPHCHGFNGDTDASASTVAYYCFKHLNEPRVTELGIVGAVGDMQEVNERMTGLNAGMVDDAVKQGMVLKSKDLRMFGRVSRPLVWFLTYSTEPFLQGLTGNEKACALFLEKNGIPLEKDGSWLRYYDLNVFQRKQLVSALINYCAEKNIPVKGLIGDVYIFLNETDGTELRDASEFSTLLNACGRHDRPDLGVKVCVGESVLHEARDLLFLHRKMISKGISFARKQVNDFGPFYFVDGRGKIDDTVIGTVLGSFYASGIITQEKPIIGFSSDEDGNVKVSGRGTAALVERGLDLGEVMRKAGEAAGGQGNGHKPAAGANFKPGSEGVFLKMAKEVIEVQLELR